MTGVFPVVILVCKHLLTGLFLANLTEKQLNIIDASIELIAEKSIQGFTIKNLSQKIGVTDGAIYRHFKSKTEILQNILHSFQNEAKETLDNVKKKEYFFRAYYFSIGEKR